MLYLNQEDIEVRQTDAAELSAALYNCIARAVTPHGLKHRTVDIVSFPPSELRHEKTISLLVLVSVEKLPLPIHLDKAEILTGLERSGIRARASLNHDSIWGQIGNVRFWIVIHKVPHNRGFNDVLMPEVQDFATTQQNR